MAGLRCPKKAWFLLHEGEGEPKNGLLAGLPGVKGRLKTMARELFPGGEEVSLDDGVENAARTTAELLRSGAETLYNPRFILEGKIVGVDIFRKTGLGWEAVKVSAATGAKRKHAKEMAYACWALERLGYALSETGLLRINGKYIRGERLEPQKLFVYESLGNKVHEHLATMGKRLEKLEKALERAEPPQNDIGLYCANPSPCRYTARCWSHVPEHSVFELERMAGKIKFDFYRQGFVALEELPEAYPYTENQRQQIECYKSGEPAVDKNGLASFLGTLKYPLYFLDFEAFQDPIPRFIGQRAYEYIPFQFSLHVQNGPGEEPEHVEFLGDGVGDPRRAMGKALVEAIPPDACLVAYNNSFEKFVVKSLAQYYPEGALQLKGIHDHILDLMQPFKKRYYYHTAMKGSHSLKNVLPVLVPELSYSGMEIGDGTGANRAYGALEAIEDVRKAEAIKGYLLEYCKLDTLAMVKIVDRLWQIVASGKNDAKII